MTINEPTIATNFGLRSTFVEVNLSQLSRNLQAIRERVSPAKIMIVVKANAYGHGLLIASQAFLEGGADVLGVHSLAEAEALRAGGVAAAILVLGPVDRINELATRTDLEIVAEGRQAIERLEDSLFVLRVAENSSMAGSTSSFVTLGARSVISIPS